MPVEDSAPPSSSADESVQSSSALRFREYGPADRGDVIQLLERTYGSSVGFTRFETGNPLGKGIVMLGFVSDRLVAFNHYQPWLIPSPDGPVLTHQAMAAAVDAQVRGQGVYAKLLEAGEKVCREKGVNFLLGFPNPAAYNSYIRRDWEDIATMHLWVMRLPSLGFKKATDFDFSKSVFQHWRSAVAGLGSITRNGEGTDAARLTFRRSRAFGFPVIKIADCLRADGSRTLDELPGLALRVKGPAVILVRCPVSRGLPKHWFTAIPRTWNTPVVVKQLAGSAEEFSALRRTAFMYGDIDAT